MFLFLIRGAAPHRAAPHRAGSIPSLVAAVSALAIDLSSRAPLAVMKIERFFWQEKATYEREFYYAREPRSNAGSTREIFWCFLHIFTLTNF